MCGIAGVASVSRVPDGRVARMLERLVHRGPDDSGLWSSEDHRVSLGQRRLAIIDLSPLGRNPMAWDQGRFWITYNGEVYNYQEIRCELEGAGYRFRSQSDTEVILASYDRWGVDCLEKFVGMFAFALWDSPRRCLFLVRDRLGKKPLYLAERSGTLAFASELKALVTDPEFNREVDPEALSLYLRYGYVPSPFSIFRGVRKLPPAHYALWTEGTLSVHRYWDPIGIALSGPREVSEDDAERELEELLKDSVRHRMIADVPLGAFLSGGIDSSLIVALMQEESRRPVRTFTIRFPNREFDEADDAAAVARHLRTEHSEESCTGAQMLSAVERLQDHFDEPFADSSAVPTYIVSQITRRHVTVALSGDGGDELFFGYPRYAAMGRARWLLGSPRPLRHALAAAASLVPRRRFRRAADILRQEDADRYARFVTLWNPGEIELLTGRAAVVNPVYTETQNRLEAIPPLERPPLIDLATYLPEDILTKVDRASMAASLEARAPLLDHRVVEMALRLPLDLKWRGGESKWLLRRILRKRVPRELIDRPKMGFGVPLSDWFRGPLRERMAEAIQGPILEQIGIHPRLPRQLWKAFLEGRSQRADLLWSLFAAAGWLERWMSAPALALAGDRA
ncbi:MAG TPA: asparagine synthase (glutamine-hydrolyzing) [Thermoanaerobaculia bacterium]|nr:asparagine synthase (glutamine-hydrolyzing) [Thermoanaerobaculia bacterium]